MKAKKTKKPRQKRVVKIERVPPVVAEFVPKIPDVIPEPVAVLVAAIQERKVEAIVLAPHADPTLLERLKNWFAGDE